MSIKKLCFTIFICVLALTFGGCTKLYDENYGSDVSTFVDPYEEPEEDLSFLPEDTAVAVAGDSSTAVSYTDEPPETLGTYELTPKIVGGDVVCLGFKFPLPYPWTADTMSAEIINMEDSGYYVSTYIFYYVEADGTRAPMLSFEIVPQNYFYLNLAKAGDQVGTSSDGGTLYLLLQQNDPLPADFEEIEKYLEIYEKLATGAYAITVTV